MIGFVHNKLFTTLLEMIIARTALNTQSLAA